MAYGEIASASAPRRRQTTKDDGLPHQSEQCKCGTRWGKITRQVLRPQGSHRGLWPDGRSFAFTVFDDPDSQTLEAGREVYAFLASLGFRTTKGVWPIRGSGTPSDHGGTCAEPAYRARAATAARRQADRQFGISANVAQYQISDDRSNRPSLQLYDHGLVARQLNDRVRLVAKELLDRLHYP